MPRVSVIIPTYNYAQFVEDAIKSVLQQTFRDFEIIVVDDGSSDNTKAKLEPYILRKEIIYLYQKNMGLPGARNTGIRHSKGELIGFLDADDLWVKEKLLRQVELFDKHPEIGFCYGNARKFKGKLALRKTAFEELQPASGSVTCQLLNDSFLPMPTVMVRREAFDYVGFFNERIRSCEDLDMWLRLSLAYPCMYVDQIVAWYRIHSISMSSNILKIAIWRLYVLENFIERNRYQLEGKCGSAGITKILGQANENAGRYALALGDSKKGREYLRKSLILKGGSWNHRLLLEVSRVPAIIPFLYRIKSWKLSQENFRPLLPNELPT